MLQHGTFRHPRKMFRALSYAFFIMLVVLCLIKGRRCRKHIGSIVLTRELSDTAPEARYHLWKIARKLKKLRTLFTSRTYAFTGLPHRSFVRSHLPKVTPSRIWFFDADIICSTPARISPSHFLPFFEISRVHIQEECDPGLWLFP